MTLVTLTGSGGRLHCVVSSGVVTAESESKSLMGALAKAYVKLVLVRIEKSISKWRKIWTER